ITENMKARAISAIVGAYVGDAAAQPLHWVYNLSDLDKAVEGYDNPEFRKPSANPYYTIATGRVSAYGDQAVVLLESLVACNGLNIDDYCERLIKNFGPGSEYDNSENDTFIQKSGVQSAYPIQGPWRPFIIKHFLANLEQKKSPTGSETQVDMHAVAVVPPLVAKYAGQPDLLDKVKSVIEVTMLHEENIAIGLAATRLLEQHVLHGCDGKAVQKVIEILKSDDRKNPTDKDCEVAKNLEEVLEYTTASNREAGKKFGIMCDIPGAFKTAVHALISLPDYKSAIRATILAGGCNASRAGFIGACKAAQNGLECIPEEWKKETCQYDKVLELATNLVQY
ncbi:crystallin J1A-like, partial [Glandiceps talaboti]